MQMDEIFSRKDAETQSNLAIFLSAFASLREKTRSQIM